MLRWDELWWTDELVDFQIEAKNQEYDIVTKTKLEEDVEKPLPPKRKTNLAISSKHQDITDITWMS